MKRSSTNLLLVLRGCIRKKGSCQKERVPKHLVSGANWMPGTAIALVNLSHHSDES